MALILVLRMGIFCVWVVVVVVVGRPNRSWPPSAGEDNNHHNMMVRMYHRIVIMKMKGTYVFVSHLCGRWLVITISLFVGVSKSENLTVAMMAVDLGFRPSQQANPPASGTGGWAVHACP